MIDVWLLASLIKPFFDIILQTYIDSLRDDTNREINHHGEPRKVGEEVAGRNVVQVTPFDQKTDMKKLKSVDERIQLDALKELYAKNAGKNCARKIEKMKKISRKLNPAACFVFVVVYWIIGIKQYYVQV